MRFLLLRLDQHRLPRGKKLHGMGVQHLGINVTISKVFWSYLLGFGSGSGSSGIHIWNTYSNIQMFDIISIGIEI
jgi:hypothetical protein